MLNHLKTVDLLVFAGNLIEVHQQKYSGTCYFGHDCLSDNILSTCHVLFQNLNMSMTTKQMLNVTNPRYFNSNECFSTLMILFIM